MPWTTNWVVPDFPQQAAATALLFSLSSLQKSMICSFFYVFKHVIVTFRGTFTWLSSWGTCVWLSSCHLQRYMYMVVILSSSGVHVYGCHLVIFRGTILLSSCHLQEYMYMVELPLIYRVLQKGNCRSSIQFHLDCLSFHFHCDEHRSIFPH